MSVVGRTVQLSECRVLQRLEDARRSTKFFDFSLAMQQTHA